MPETVASKRCPICGKQADVVLTPFCSKRCADVDLHRWLAGAYAIPAAECDEEHDAIEDPPSPSRQ